MGPRMCDRAGEGGGRLVGNVFLVESRQLSWGWWSVAGFVLRLQGRFETLHHVLFGVNPAWFNLLSSNVLKLREWGKRGSFLWLQIPLSYERDYALSVTWMHARVCVWTADRTVTKCRSVYFFRYWNLNSTIPVKLKLHPVSFFLVRLNHKLCASSASQLTRHRPGSGPHSFLHITNEPAPASRFLQHLPGTATSLSSSLSLPLPSISPLPLFSWLV